MEHEEHLQRIKEIMASMREMMDEMESMMSEMMPKSEDEMMAMPREERRGYEEKEVMSRGVEGNLGKKQKIKV